MKLSAKATFRPRGDFGQFVPAKISPAVVASVTAAAQLIQTTAQGLCPVDTGALRDSIGVTIDDSGLTVVGTVAPTEPYAGYVEFGTGIRGAASAGAGGGPYSETWEGMPAQPYMRPALDETKPAILELFRSQIATAIQS